MATQTTTQTQTRGTAQRGRKGNRGRGGSSTRGGGRGGKPAKVPGDAVSASDGPVVGETEKDEVKTVDQAAIDDEDGDDTVCWICAEPVKYYALSQCGHRTCHVCALRLRALYKKLECTFCKVRMFS